MFCLLSEVLLICSSDERDADDSYVDKVDHHQAADHDDRDDDDDDRDDDDRSDDGEQ